MKNNLSFFTCIICLMFVACQKELIPEIFAKKPQPTLSTWDLDSLFATPDYKVIFERAGVKGIVYKGLDYRGVQKETFAYYASPTTLGKGSSGKSYPAVVCVHGGGGQAFEEWVKIWAEKGYAAIAMDLRGYRENGIALENGFKEPYPGGTPHFTANQNINSDWFFQAVADVVIAHSLIRSFDEVNADKTAITGISWGGILTTLISGLDPRFKVAVPVYGCGYLSESGMMAPQIKAESLLAQQRWGKVYDPSNYIYKARIPMLFVNGTNDPCFFLDQWSKTYLRTTDRAISLRYGLLHGHVQGWEPAEIYQFVSNILQSKESYPVPNLSKVSISNNTITGEFTIPSSYTKMFLNYTCDNNPELDKRIWTKTAIDFNPNSKKVSIPIEANCTMCAVSVEDANGNHFSTQLLVHNN